MILLLGFVGVVALIAILDSQEATRKAVEASAMPPVRVGTIAEDKEEMARYYYANWEAIDARIAAERTRMAQEAGREVVRCLEQARALKAKTGYRMGRRIGRLFA